VSAACPRRWLIVSLTVCSCAAGCGSPGQHAAPSPQLPRPLAQRLAHEADVVAARWQAGDRSGAERIADRLQREVIRAINSGRVPPALQEELQGGANVVASRPDPRARARAFAAWLRLHSG
jgi:hypothetical protein